MRIISMKDVRQVIKLHELMGLSVRRIEGATRVAKSTVSDYIKRYKQSSLSIKEIETLDDDTLKLKLFPDLASVVVSKKPMPNYAYIHSELKKRKKTKVTLMLLWEEYKELNPNGYEYTQFGHYYRKFKQKLNPSMRMTHIAGEKLYVDYSGLTVPIYDAKTGAISKAQIFVAVLGASGYTFVHATHSQTKEDFINSHALAYNFFGGVPRVVVPDNLKSAVIYNNKQKGIVINESYADFNRHYGVTVEPTRVYKPKDKAVVEQGVQAIQRYIIARLRYHKFFSISELNDALGSLLDRYNNKIVKHLQKSRSELFEEIEKDALMPLPANRYIYKEFKIAKVDQSYHIYLLKCYYSVPYRYKGERVDVWYCSNSIYIYHKNRLIATHPRLRGVGLKSTLTEHMPSSHQYMEEKMNPDRLYGWAKSIGEYSLKFVQEEFDRVDYPPQAYNKIVSVLKLAKQYGKTELELTLMYALEKDTLRVKSIKSIIDKRLYLTKSANNNNISSKKIDSLFNNHSNIRGAKEYK